MATAMQGLRSTAKSCVCSQKQYRYSIGFVSGRAFSMTAQRPNIRAAESRSGNDPRVKELLEKNQRLGLAARNEDRNGEEFDEIHRRIDAILATHEPLRQRKKLKESFMNMGEVEPWEDEYTMQDDDDDMNSLAHGELEQHREMRHYARLVAWEMPLLSKLAKPFQPPTRDMPLRFRYTTYMGEHHPAEKKVVLEFSPADMPGLTKVQADKLRKLVGVRYNPEKDIVKMSCEMFETQAQNKRYLGDIVDTLLKEAKDPTDTFEDIPLDTRHHPVKPKPQFPKEWAVTETRRQELIQYRQAMMLKDQEREITGQLIDGIRQIQEGLSKPVDTGTRLPQPVLSVKGGKKVGVRR